MLCIDIFFLILFCALCDRVHSDRDVGTYTHDDCDPSCCRYIVDVNCLLHER